MATPQIIMSLWMEILRSLRQILWVFEFETFDGRRFDIFKIQLWGLWMHIFTQVFGS